MKTAKLTAMTATVMTSTFCTSVVELTIKRWTRHHVHHAHHVSSSEEEKAPPGHYKEHTSRSILDIRGLASLRKVEKVIPQY
jgi:hypothetical protein